jgi:hypothetical protein
MAHCVDASTSNGRDFNRGCTNDIGIFSGQLAIAQQSEERGLLGNYQDGYQAELAAGAADYREGYSKYAYCPEGTADYCAGFSIEFGANSRSIRSDLSSVLNLAASFCFFQASCGFKVGRINNP